MSALMSRRPHSPVAARVRRISAVLTAAGASLLAWVAATPAAFAGARPIPVGENATAPALPAPRTVIHVVQAGGMPGWQIAAIAVAAALAAAAAAVFLDRAWSHRRPVRAA
jgi:hypothetical protein